MVNDRLRVFGATAWQQAYNILKLSNLEKITLSLAAVEQVNQCL